MKTKDEVIAAAYGEHWDAVKEFVDENGWLDWGFEGYNSAGCSKCSLHRIQSLCGGVENSEYKHIRNSDKGRAERYFRPISLRGIETNNGWTKIESELDLPTINNVECAYIYKGNIERGDYVSKHFDRPKTVQLVSWKDVTHYRVIEPFDKPHF